MEEKKDIRVVVDMLEDHYGGRGYFSFITQAIACLGSYYEDTTPIYIDFSNINNGLIGAAGENMFEYIFEQPFLKNIDKNKHSIVERNVWLNNRLNINFKGESLEIGRKAYQDFMKVKENIQKEFDGLYEPYKDYKILGIHKRGTDHGYHGELLSIDYYLNEVKKYEKEYDKIFLAADENKTLEIFKNTFKDKLIYLDCKKSDDNTPIFKKQCDKKEIIKEVFFDAFFLSKCNLLLRTKSNVSRFSIVANPDLKFIDIDNHIIYK